MYTILNISLNQIFLSEMSSRNICWCSFHHSQWLGCLQICKFILRLLFTWYIVTKHSFLFARKVKTKIYAEDVNLLREILNTMMKKTRTLNESSQGYFSRRMLKENKVYIVISISFTFTCSQICQWNVKWKSVEGHFVYSVLCNVYILHMVFWKSSQIFMRLQAILLRDNSTNIYLTI
jgi:hypothetical protein